MFPYTYITVQLIRNGPPTDQDNTQSFEYVLYGWATEGYKAYAYLWEPVNALIILCTVMAAELLDENQRIVQAIIAGTSSVAHLIVRPYDDRAGNLVVVMFGICELIGIVGADENLVLQWIHLVLLIVTVLFLLGFSLSAAVGAVYEKRQQRRLTNNKPSHNTVSKFEGVMLTPFLVLLWVLLSPLFLVSKLLSNPKGNCLMNMLAKLFLYPLALILSAVQQSILGKVIYRIGRATYLDKQEKWAWDCILNLKGNVACGYGLSVQHPELFGKLLMVDHKGCAKHVEQVGYASYQYLRPQTVHRDRDVTIVFAHAPKHANTITLHLFKDLKVSITVQEGIAPAKIISYETTNEKITFEVPEVMIAKPYKRYWNSLNGRAVVDVGIDLWKKLSWKEKWDYIEMKRYNDDIAGKKSNADTNNDISSWGRDSAGGRRGRVSIVPTDTGKGEVTFM